MSCARLRLASLLSVCVMGMGACEGGADRHMDARVDSTDARIDSLAHALTGLRATVEFNDYLATAQDAALLTPASEGYSLVHADIGMLTVAIKNVQPYANGTRITLQFGNTASATINGLSATLEWGQVDTAGAPLVRTAHSKNVTLVESLRPGAWTSVPFVLEGVPPSQFGFVRVRNVAHTGIRLLR